MQTQLGFKAQEIKGGYNKDTRVWAKAYYNIQEDKELMSIRGHIFSLISIEGPENLDYEFFGKILFNSLQEEYYGDKEGTPLQALENASLDTRDKLKALLEQSELTVSMQDITFNITSASVWGKILYIVNLGTNKAFIIRAGKTDTIASESLESINSVSGRVDEKDTFFLGNRSFANIFESISNISELQDKLKETEKEGGIAAILVNLELTQTPSAEEKITFITETNKDENKLGIIETIKKLIPKSGKIKVNKTSNFSTKQKVGLTTVLVGVLLASAVFINLKRQASVNENKMKEAEQTTITNSIDQAKKYIGINNDKAREILVNLKNEDNTKKPDIIIAEINTLLDQINNVQKITDSTALYDFSLKNPNFEMETILVSNEILYLLDKNKGSIYSYQKTTGAQEVASKVANIKYMVLCDKGLIAGSNTEYINIDKGNVISLVTPEKITGTSCYLNNLYFTTPTEIIKYTDNEDSFSKNSWATGLQNALGSQIDSNIYVLENGNTVTKLFTGEKQTFNIKGLDKPLKNATDLFLAKETIYILDSGNNRIVSISTNGNFIEQFDISNYSGTSKIWVTDATVYLANKTTVYTFSLKETPTSNTTP